MIEGWQQAMIGIIEAAVPVMRFVGDMLPTLMVGFLVIWAMLMTGLFHIPIGYDRGKIKWFGWCGCGGHPVIVYWHGDGSGFQTIHPDELGGDS